MESSPTGAVALSSDGLTRAGFTHAFFTRRGGVSPAPYESLNFAVSTGDEPANVARNVELAAAHLGVERVYFLSQVHGAHAVRLEGNEDPGAVVRLEGDATFSTRPGVACGVRSADCGTVLVGDRRTGAALAIHAGWRGTELGVVEAAIAELRAAIAPETKAPELVAAVGPLIEACCFEVGDDVAQRLAKSSPIGERAITARRGEKAFVDLRAILDAKLGALGVHVDHVRGCTVCDAERFFSFRREGKTSGRLLAAIVARPASA